MPRPEPKPITFTIDGREVTAPENAMLVDAAKLGDVEIPVFCYEPKLGAPVGACRMCLVEIEGIPKLQTGCSTPVKDGMVVHTRTDRVKTAQNAVLEFLLINHPLDCPVCDKGGECPLQDIAYGWGPGTSRHVEPKRHFKKPLELSPLIAIDRERCILCYRCVRYSQEIAEDDQLVLLERSVHSFVGTFDGHPYVAPFSGNIIELCPVGALTSRAYRFRARPWDVEQSGSVCVGCAAQCNVSYTVRDDRVQRVLARDNGDVDDGWLCDKGRFAYQSIDDERRLATPLVRSGSELVPASWDQALEAAGRTLSEAGARCAALAGGETTNEEGFLLASLVRDRLGSPHLASRVRDELPLDETRALADPALRATVPDLEFAHTVLLLDCDPIDEAPVLDLRIRKGVRRNRVGLIAASARPTALDPNAVAALRFAPGGGEAFLVALAGALAGDEGAVSGAATAAGTTAGAVRELAELLARGGEDIVIVYGERMLAGEDPANAARALLEIARMLGLGERAGAGLLELPSSANGRGLREAAGFAPGHGPGYAELGSAGADARGTGAGARGIAEGLAGGQLKTVVLAHADPLRAYPDRPLWDRALGGATVIAIDSVLTESAREHADVVFPAEVGAEKEGTLTHPDGRLQRLRPAIGRPRLVRAGWRLIQDLARAAGHDLEILSGPMAFTRMVERVPFYRGLTLEEIGGTGVRWQDREAASAFAWRAPSDAGQLEVPKVAPPQRVDALRLGSFRPLWAAKEVDHAPVLAFIAPRQLVELAPEDARRLGVSHGDAVELAAGTATITAPVALRSAVPAGSAFVREATREQGANRIADGVPTPLVTVRKVSQVGIGAD